MVVTRNREQAEELARPLTELGARVLMVPTIDIKDPESWAEIDHAVEQLAGGTYRWVLFTSVNSVERLLKRAGDIRPFEGTPVAAVGSSTAAALERWGIRPQLVPDSFEGDWLSNALGLGSGRILLPRVAGGPRAIVDGLSALGWEVHEVDAYRNVPATNDSEGFAAVLRRDFDVVTFTSPSTVTNFSQIAPAAKVGIAPDADGARTVACIGPSTAAAARALGVRVDIVAPRHTVEGLVEAICTLKDGTIDR